MKYIYILTAIIIMGCASTSTPPTIDFSTLETPKVPECVENNCD
jgi:hypothetical protein